VGVVCGKAAWMRRFHEEKPGHICFARGTFNAHPGVMGAMNVFLKRVQGPAIQAVYQKMEGLWIDRMKQLNDQLLGQDLPVRVVGMATVWSVVYEVPSRYNWMLQFYMREQGIALSWVGTGRIIFNFAFEDEHFAEFCQRFIRAAQAMQNDGWWWTAQGQSNRTIRREVMREMVRIKWAL
jgi:glutamate-1-semialdehyde 2,1-aminomutase